MTSFEMAIAKLMERVVALTEADMRSGRPWREGTVYKMEGQIESARKVEAPRSSDDYTDTVRRYEQALEDYNEWNYTYAETHWR